MSVYLTLTVSSAFGNATKKSDPLLSKIKSTVVLGDCQYLFLLETLNEGRRHPLDSFAFRTQANPSVKDPKAIFFTGGGPGFSGLTMNSFSPLSEYADIIMTAPPGSVIPTTNGKWELDELDRRAHIYGDYSDPYMETVESYRRLIKRMKRTPDQEVILVGHSFGALQMADVAVKYHKELNIKGIVFISATLSYMGHKIWIPKKVRAERGSEWDIMRRRVVEDPSEKNFREFIYSYGDLISSQSKDGATTAEIKRLLETTPVARTAFIHVKRKIPSAAYRLQLKTLADYSFRSLLVDKGVYEILKADPLLLSLRDLHIPKIAIIGERDFLTPIELVVPEYNIAGVIVKTVENGSHFPFVDSPAELNLVFRRWLLNEKSFRALQQEFREHPGSVSLEIR